MNNGPIAGLISGCVIYLIFRLVAHVARVMFMGRQKTDSTGRKVWP